MDKAKKYNKIKMIIGITKSVINWLLILTFVISGMSEFLVNFLSSHFENNYLTFLLFTFTIGFALSILFLPLSFYSEYILEHKFGLSNQTIKKWINENLKELAVGLLIGIPILLLFYYLLLTFQENWWIPFAVGLFFISVILAKILPVLILPLFYKITPLENEELKKRILNLTENININIENVFKFDMSKNTKKANAAFTGLGKTKKIILGDTLLENFTNDEIEVVIAHELGHFKHKHIVKNIIISTISSFLTFFILAILYKNSIHFFGFTSILEISALPVLALWATIIGVIQTPITNYISRKFEYEADSFAIEETNKAEVFIQALQKLNKQNLGDPEPHPLVEWYSYSHPSISKRIKFIREIAN